MAAMTHQGLFGSLVFTLLSTLAAPQAVAQEGQAPAGVPVGAAQSFKPPTFADDTLMYVLGPAFRNPFITTPSQPDGADISRHAIEFKHVDAWKYGHNLVEVMIKKSSDVEPAAGGGTGATGLYSIFRAGVGINRLAGKPLIAIGPLRDIDIQAGMNLETKNSDYAPAERTLYFGPNFQFRFGAGFLNVGLQLRKEWNHNGNLGVRESYDVDVNIEPVWHFPFRIGPARLTFDGFADYNTPKGKDAAGRDTRAEFITRPQLKLDISRVVGRQARVLEVGVGFQYWHNMFGKDADRVPGAKEFTPVLTLTVHLPLGNSGH
jgi:nucleoside-specific outer membrane channel protein Tsx